MARSFCCWLAGGEDGGDCRAALCLQRNDGLSSPKVRRAKNLRMAIEICHINPGRTGWPHYDIERRGRQSIVTLMRHEACPGCPWRAIGA
jgi:hypothetical protein